MGTTSTMLGLEGCAGEDGGATLQCLDSLKIALDPGMPGKRVSAMGSRRPGPLHSHPVGLLREKPLLGCFLSVLLGAE